MVSESVVSSPFKAIADPTRRAILEALTRGELPVQRIAAGFSMSRPAVSKHLRVLREAGLVKERRHGRQNLYRVELQALEEVSDWVRGCRGDSRVSAPVVRRRGTHRKRRKAVAKPRTVPTPAPAPDGGEWRVW